MKKLILCDMDGTLLDSQKRLPAAFDDVYQELKAQDVAFGVASGRQYYCLRKQFAKYDDMLILAENGAMVYQGDKALFNECLSDEDILKIDKLVGRYYKTEVVFAGLKGAYIPEDIDPLVYDHIKMYYDRIYYFSNVENLLKEDSLVKVAYFIKDGKPDEHFKRFNDLKGDYNVVISGKNWIDINSLTVSKGMALNKLKNIYGLKDEDCYAFGDYENDISLLQAAYHSYAMANATESVKKVARATCLSNDENGVMLKLKELFKLKSII